MKLESHCLLCQKLSLQLANSQDPTTKGWKKACADSICSSLRITGKPICSVWFKRATYCEDCYQTFCDFEFIEKSIQRLQKRLQQITETAEQLILKNVEDLGSGEDRTGEEYFEAVKFIGRELSRRGKNTFDDDINDEGIGFRSAVLQSDEIETNYEVKTEVDCDPCDVIYDDNTADYVPVSAFSETEFGSQSGSDPEEDPLGGHSGPDSPINQDQVSERHPPSISKRSTRQGSRYLRNSSGPNTTSDAASISAASSMSMPIQSTLGGRYRRIAPAPFPRVPSPSPPQEVPSKPTPCKLDLERSMARRHRRWKWYSRRAQRRTNTDAPKIINSAAITSTALITNVALRPPIAPVLAPTPAPITNLAPIMPPLTQVAPTRRRTPITIGPANTPVYSTSAASASVLNSLPLRRIAPAPSPLRFRFPLPLIPIAPTPPQIPVTSTARSTSTTVGRHRDLAPSTSIPETALLPTPSPTSSPIRYVLGSMISGNNILPSLPFWMPDTFGGNVIRTNNPMTQPPALIPTIRPEVIDIDMSDTEAPADVDIDPADSTVLDSSPGTHSISSASTSSTLPAIPSTVPQVLQTPVRKKVKPLKSKKIRCSYVNCNYETSAKFPYLLDAHVQQVHRGGSRPFRVSNCNETFKTRHNLNKQVNKVHRKPVKSPPEIIDVDISDVEAPSETNVKGSTLNKRRTTRRKYLTRSRTRSTTHPVLPKRPRIGSYRQQWKRLYCSYEKCDYNTLERFEHLLVAHVRKVHEGDQKPFHCSDCTRTYTSMARLTDHVKKVHRDPVIWPCSHCPRTFKYQTSLDNHMKCRHPYPLNIVRSYPKCKICTKMCRDEAELAAHEDLHNVPAETENVLSCVLCTTKFSSDVELGRHVNRAHEDEYRTVKCPDCDELFFRKEELRSHVRNNHTKRDPKFKCTVAGCDFVGVGPSSYAGHKISHSIAKPFKCNRPNCNKKFKHQRGLDIHTQVHAMKDKLIEPKFTCSICSRGFIRQDSLVTHMQSHNNLRPFLCDQCPMAFKALPSLTKHVWRHAQRAALQTSPEFDALENQERRKQRNPADQTAIIGDCCIVCGDTMNLVIVGSITTCFPCRMFFEYHETSKTSNSVKLKTSNRICDSGECTITTETRSDCKSCRLKKCYAVGMKIEDYIKPVTEVRISYRRGKSRCKNDKPKPLRSENSGTREECPICFSKSSRIGDVFGATACHNCRSFFAKATQLNRVFKCAFDNNCQLTPERDVYCASCRMQKCIAAGMKTEAVGVNSVSLVTGKCPVCERDMELKNLFGVLACANCGRNFWMAVRLNRPKSCPKEVPCRNLRSCHGCRWTKFLQTGFKPELVNLPKGVMEPVQTSYTCAVCGDAGKHRCRDGHVCGSCSLFFSKITVKEAVPVCTKGGNCPIDMLTRVDCKACRLQKCYQVGMRRKKAYTRRTEPDVSVKYCKICGDFSVGSHYGVQCCESCSFFFMKGSGRDFGDCMVSHGNCEITKETRSKCQPCRMAKCVEQGMKKAPERRRLGRIPKDSEEARALRKLISNAPAEPAEATSAETESTAENAVEAPQFALELVSVPHESPAGTTYSFSLPANEW